MQVPRFLVVAFIACFAMAVGSPAFSEDPADPKLGGDPRVVDAIGAWLEWVEYQLEVNNVPGASVAVVHDQEILYAGGIGLANPETGQKAASDTLYSICSISKLFTSTAVMQLRDDGKLRLDDPAAEHLDWFDIEDVHPGDESVTIRRMLTHSSGLPRESDSPYWNGPDFEFPTHDEIVQRLGEQETLYPSGRYFQYSNLAMTLLGEIVASASGQDYHQYIRQEILKPLEMNDTYSDIPAKHYGGRLALGFSERNRDGSRDQLPMFQALGIAPAAGFASSAEDLARFAMWQMRLLGDGGKEVLRASTLREMQRVHWVDPNWETTWGLGFSVTNSDGTSMVGHGGACPGYYSTFRLKPKAKLSIVVLSNAIGTEVAFYAAKGFEFIEPAVGAASDESDKAPEVDPELERYEGVFHTSWGETAIVHWKDGLAGVTLNTRNPYKGLEKYKKVGEHTFRRVRDDDDSLGEEIFFEVDDDGNVLRYRQHSVWATKVR